MAQWQEVDLGDLLVGEDLVDQVQDVVDVITTLGDVAVAVLQILRAFLLGLPNPATAAVQILLNEIQQLLDNLRETGSFGLFLIPTTLEELQQYRGGLPQFRQLFIQSIYDVEDPNRPQIGSTGVLGGLFLFVNKENPAAFLRQMQLLNFYFGRLTNLGFPAPINVTATPADDDGNPVDSLVNLFSDPETLTSIRLEWEEPKFTQDLFYDFYRHNKFYIERSKSREGILLTREATPRTKEDPLDKERTIQQPLLNQNGEAVALWEPVNPNDPFVTINPNIVSGPGDLEGTNFIAGTYFKVLTNLEAGIENGYYYRIRSVPPDAELEEEDLKVTTETGEETVTFYRLKVAGQDYEKSEPSVPVFGYIPDVDLTFDMPTALLNAYRAAYILRFDDSLTINGDVMIGSETLDTPIPEFLEVLDKTDGPTGAGFVDYDDAGETFRVFEGPLFLTAGAIEGYQETRQFISTTGAITNNQVLENDPFSGAREMFANDVFGLSPRQRFRLFVDRRALRKVDEILPTIIQNENLFDLVRTLYEQAEPNIQSLLTGSLTLPQIDLFLREEVNLIIEGVDRFDIQGAPPNWESVRLFQDLIPQVKPLLDRLFKSMSALFNVFQNVSSSLDATIEGLQNRLAALDSIVDSLDAIIALIESLPSDFEIAVLWVPPSTGGNTYLVQEFLNATNPPDTEPTDFSGGVVLAFGGASAADITGIVNAIRFIFGF